MEWFLKGLGVFTTVLTPILAFIALRIHKKNTVTNRFKLLLDLKTSYLKEAHKVRESIKSYLAGQKIKENALAFPQNPYADPLYNEKVEGKTFQINIKRVAAIENKLNEIEKETEKYHEKIVADTL